jgi:hypothetical protein
MPFVYHRFATHPQLDGEWSCHFSGQSAPITITTVIECTYLQVDVPGTPVEQWFACFYAPDGNNAATVSVPSYGCPANLQVNKGTLIVSSDGKTLTISEQGNDPDAGAEQLTGTCTRTKPAMPPLPCSS